MNEKGTILNNKNRLKIITIFILILFSTGFLIGGSLIYIVTSTEIYQLRDQIQSTYHGTIIPELQNHTYYSNESLLSDLYNNVKDSIVVVSGTVKYQSYFGARYTKIQGSGFVYKFNEDFVIITNNHVLSGVSEIIVTFANGNSYPAEIIGFIEDFVKISYW